MHDAAHLRSRPERPTKYGNILCPEARNLLGLICDAVCDGILRATAAIGAKKASGHVIKMKLAARIVFDRLKSKPHGPNIHDPRKKDCQHADVVAEPIAMLVAWHKGIVTGILHHI